MLDVPTNCPKTIRQARSLEQSSKASTSTTARRHAHEGTSIATGRSPAAFASAIRRSMTEVRAIERSAWSEWPGIGSSATSLSEVGHGTVWSASSAPARSASDRLMPGGHRKTLVTTSLLGAAKTQRRSWVEKEVTRSRSVCATLKSSGRPSSGRTSSVCISRISKRSPEATAATIDTVSGRKSTPSGRLCERLKIRTITNPLRALERSGRRRAT